MKCPRRLRTLLVFLLFGAIVNVAVAWGSCLGVHIGTPQYEQRAFGLTLIAVTHDRLGEVYPISNPPPDEYYDGWVRAGWPVRALGARVDVREYFRRWIASRMGNRLRHEPNEASIEHGLIIPSAFLTQRASVFRLPVIPLWPGFALNTIFYAAILWLLFAFPFALRRHLRTNRNLCLTCAYPIGTNPVCTECGTPIPVATPPPNAPLSGGHEK